MMFWKKKKEKKVTCDTWHLTRDTWHMTYDTWHVTHGGGWKFSQNFSSPALMVWDWQYLEYISTNHRWVNESINHGGDCRTAPATPGLLIIPAVHINIIISNTPFPFYNEYLYMKEERFCVREHLSYHWILDGLRWKFAALSRQASHGGSGNRGMQSETR